MLGFFDDKHQIYTRELYIDELTGALNRRYLNLIVDREIQRSRRYKHKFSIMIADLDNFKSINDTRGHLTGDKALRFFTKTIRDSLRASDSVVRYGGDEFIVILPNTDIQGAKEVGKRIIKLLKENKLGDLTLSASIGIATFPDHGDTWDEIFQSADKALYNSKRLGKGRVSLPEESILKLMLPTRYLVGRREEGSWILSKSLEPGTLHIIKGEVGVGKTRLALETLKKGKIPHAYARSMGPLKNVSYFLIRDLLKNILNNQRDRVFSAYEILNNQHRSEISKFMPDIFKIHVEKEGKKDKYTLYESLTTFLANIASKQLVIVFDDLQWVDYESAEFVHYLIETKLDNLSFLGIFREEEIHKSPIYEIITLLGRTRQYAELHLAPLNENETAEMLQLALGTIPSKALMETVYEESGGNPFFIEEILHKLYDEQWLTLENNTWTLKRGYKISPSRNIEQIVERKIQELSDREKNVLDYASVYGRELDAMILSKASGFNEGEVFDILDKLVNLNILKEGTATDYVFMEGVIRDIIESKLSKGKLKFYHKKIATTIEEVHSTDIKEHLEELVYHYKIAGNIDKIRHYAKIAGDKAYEVYAYEKAVEFYSMAIDRLPGGEELYSIRQKLIDSLKSLGKHRKAISELYSLLKEYPEKQKEIHESLADSYIRLGEWRNAIEHYKNAIELAEEEREKYRIEVEMAWALLNLAKHKEATNILEKAKEYFKTHGEEKDNYNMFVWIYTGFATIANIQQDYEKAALNYQKALIFSEKMNSPYNIAVSHLNLGIALSSLSKYEESLSHFQKGVDICLKNNYFYLYATTLQSLAQLYAQMGNFKKALNYFTESERRFELMKNYYNLMLNHLMIMEVYEALDQLDKTLSYARKAEKIAQELRTPFDYIYARIGIANISNLKGNYRETLNILREIEDSAQKAPDKLLYARTLDIKAEAHIGLNEYENAINVVKKALKYVNNLEVARPIACKLHLKAALIHKAFNNKDSVKRQLDTAISFSEHIKGEYSRLQFKFDLAYTLLRIGQKERAKKLLREIKPKMKEKNARLYLRLIDELISE